jgi:hypothetical protein
MSKRPKPFDSVSCVVIILSFVLRGKMSTIKNARQAAAPGVLKNAVNAILVFTNLN